MKLRRALVTAAATAAIAPLSLMAAGAAFADTDPSTGTGTTQSTETTGTTPSDDTTTGTAPTSGDDADGSGDTSTSGDDTTSTDGSDSADDKTGDADGTDKTGEQPDGTSSSSAPATPSNGSTAKETPSDEPTDCPVDDNGDDGSALTIGVSGLPGKIVAGSGWHKFTLTAANHSDQSLGTVDWFVLVDNDSVSENEKDWLSNYARVQYLDPETKTWKSISEDLGNGIFFGETDLGAKETVDIQLRLDITAKAPAGDGFTVGLGGYVDEKLNCVHNTFGYYEFTVLKPGSDNENPGQATPVDKGDKGEKPAGDKKPQGGAAELPVTGSLAETGSSSMLPTIGLVGGIAVVAGAGAVFAVRRRKSGNAAA